jgi:hypothetical protein
MFYPLTCQARLVLVSMAAPLLARRLVSAIALAIAISI